MLLLIDNAPAHPSIEKLTSHDGRVKTMFLPANTTSILQSLNQEILEVLKRRYKKSLLCHIILENEMFTSSVPDIVKALTIKDAIYWSAAAWEEVKSSSLKKSWNKLIPSSAPPNDDPQSDTENNTFDDEFASLFSELGCSDGNPSCQTPHACGTCPRTHQGVNREIKITIFGRTRNL